MQTWGWIVVAIIVIAAVAGAAIVSLQPQQAVTTAKESEAPKVELPEVEFSIVGGEIKITKYGFAFKGQELSSPGPKISVKKGSTVTISFTVEGQLPHTFNVVSEKRFNMEALWKSSIGTATDPIPSGQTRSVTIVPDKPGKYFYVCQVPGHIEAGMWGEFVVEE